MQLIRPSTVALESYRSERISGDVERWVAPAVEGSHLLISIHAFPAGVATAAHTHSTDQLLIAISGQGFVESDGERIEFAEGDVVHCPARIAHRHGALADAAVSVLSVILLPT